MYAKPAGAAAPATPEQIPADRKPKQRCSVYLAPSEPFVLIRDRDPFRRAIHHRRQRGARQFRTIIFLAQMRRDKVFELVIAQATQKPGGRVVVSRCAACLLTPLHE